jgi:TetR/AcrR family transcriptional regulator, regulator of cefoperazone and chloramphenicol sensitivity
MPDVQEEQVETRQRLIEAAGEVFASQGFRNATVREICQRAGANVASVNYHFGDKEGLYLEVLRFAHTCAFAKYPPDMGLAPGATPKQRLHAFVRSFLLRVLDTGRPAWHGKLMVREIADPTPALESIVKDGIRPHFAALRGIVTDLLGPQLSSDPERVRFAAWSVVGQCLFYFVGRPVILQLHPGQGYEPDDLERIAKHITDFSLVAMKHYPKPSTKGEEAAR